MNFIDIYTHICKEAIHTVTHFLFPNFAILASRASCCFRFASNLAAARVVTVHIYIYVCIYIYTYIYTYICMYICVHIYTYIYIYIYVYVNIYVYTWWGRRDRRYGCSNSLCFLCFFLFNCTNGPFTPLLILRSREILFSP
jgi:hypothetical protein